MIMTTSNTVLTTGASTVTVDPTGNVALANGSNVVSVDAATGDLSVAGAGNLAVTIKAATGDTVVTVGQNSVSINAATGDFAVVQAGPTTPPVVTPPPADTGTGGTTTPPADGGTGTTPPADGGTGVVTPPVSTPTVVTPVSSTGSVQTTDLVVPFGEGFALDTPVSYVGLEYPAGADPTAIASISLTANVRHVKLFVANSSTTAQTLDLESSAGLIDGGLDSGTLATYTLPASVLGYIEVCVVSGVIYCGRFTTIQTLAPTTTAV
jgi:hypothetical protein